MKRFSLQSLLVLVTAICAWIACLRIGILPLVLFGAPFGLLLISIRVLRFDANTFAQKCQKCVPPAVCCGLIAIAIYHCGVPNDLYTWLCIIGPVLWSVEVLLIASKKYIWLALAPIGFYLHVLSPADWIVRDLANGEVGIVQLPRLIFIQPGPNSDVLVDLAGRQRREMIWYVNCNSGDTVERVDSHSILFDEKFRSYLEMLPSQSARIRVVKSLRDPKNLARVHQGLLLTCVGEWGYPVGYSAKTWWLRHECAFVPRTNSVKAVALVWGWSERVTQILSLRDKPDCSIEEQLRTAQRYEHGRRCADPSFMNAFMSRRYSGYSKDDGQCPIAWWGTDLGTTNTVD